MKKQGKIAAIDLANLSKRDIRVSLMIIAGLFFIFGFVTWINSILIPYFKIACELSNFESYLVAFAFYISYFVMAVPSSYLLRSVGFKKSIMYGLFVMALGMFVFVPAALQRAYPLFLLGLFVIGVGLAILQTASNPYITILGPKDSAAQRISIVGIFNKSAGIIAPLLFAAVILRTTDNELFKALPSMDAVMRNEALNELIRRVIKPYAIVGAILVIIGIFIRFSILPEINTEEVTTAEEKTTHIGKTRIIEYPHLILGAFAIFIHVGTQVIGIDTIIGYANTMHIPLLEAKAFPSYVLFLTICGYVSGILLIPRFISQVTALRFCTILGLVLSILILITHGQVTLLHHKVDVSIWFLVLLGFANSLVWAGIWPLALANLGKFVKIGASVLIMGLCGSAILPLIYGQLADTMGAKQAYILLIPCYLFLVYYAFKGHKISRWRRKP